MTLVDMSECPDHKYVGEMSSVNSIGYDHDAATSCTIEYKTVAARVHRDETVDLPFLLCANTLEKFKGPILQARVEV